MTDMASQKRHSTDGQLTASKKIKRIPPEWCSTFRDNVEALVAKNCNFKSSVTTDVELLVEGKTFKFHKSELIRHSRYFMNLLTSGEELEQPIQINEIKAKVMKPLINYIYTGKMTITSDDVQSLLDAAIFIQADDMRDWCIKSMLDHMSAFNCLGVWQTTEYYLDRLTPEYNNCAKKYVQENFRLVCQQDSFLELSKDMLIKLISDEKLCVESENQVARAVLQWSHAAKQGREGDFIDVLQDLKLEQLSSIPLIEQIKRRILKIKSDDSRVINKLLKTIGEDPESTTERGAVVCNVGGLRQNDNRTRNVSYLKPGNSWRRVKSIPSDLDIIEGAVVSVSSYLIYSRCSTTC